MASGLLPFRVVGNSKTGHGVYTTMRRGIACLLWSFTALAQPPQADPVGAAIQAHWKARTTGHFEEAAAKRGEARALVEHMPAEAPQFGSWVQQVAQLYQNGGMSAKSSAIVQDALARAGKLGDAHPARILLLNALADYWEQDRNLLKAAATLEKAVAALDAAPPAEPAAARTEGGGPPVARFVAINGRRLGFYGDMGSDYTYVYQRLAGLYQQLGRPDAVAAVRVKILARIKNNDAAVASFYESQGKLDDAAALYRKQVDQAGGDPVKSTPPLQSLSNLYARQGRYDDAAAALQQVIAGWETSTKPEAGNQTMWLRQSLAGILNQAGQTEAADKVYQQMLAESATGDAWARVQALANYSNHLTMTQRAPQAENLLKDYLANHADLEPPQQINLLYALSNAAGASGDSERAELYQRSARERQAQAQPVQPAQVVIGSDLQKAESAANGQKTEEAFSLALAALDNASRASDRDQVAWQVPQIAQALAQNKAAGKADQLYQRTFGVIEGWVADTMQPMVNVAQNYVRFLMSQKERWSEVPQAIQRYRNNLVAMHGPDTGHLADVYRMTIEFARLGGAQDAAAIAAQDLLALEEAHNGVTSEPYLEALDTMASLYESSNDPAQELSLRRQTIAIADLVYPANDPRRGFTRTNVAFALARRRQFDEAERLAREAVAIGEPMQPRQVQFAQQLEQIRQMRNAPPSAASAQRDASGLIVVQGHWFQGQDVMVYPGLVPAAAPPPPPPPPKKQ